MTSDQLVCEQLHSADLTGLLLTQKGQRICDGLVFTEEQHHTCPWGAPKHGLTSHIYDSLFLLLIKLWLAGSVLIVFLTAYMATGMSVT